MSKIGHILCVCRQLCYSSPKIQNFAPQGYNFGAVLGVRPSRCITTRCLPHLTTSAHHTTTDYCSLQQQPPSSQPQLSTDQILRTFVSKELCENRLVNSLLRNDSHKITCATSSNSSSLCHTSNQGQNRAAWSSVDCLLSSGHRNLTDTALLAYYAKTGSLSKRWISTSAIKHWAQQSDDDKNSKKKEQNDDLDIDESKLTLMQKFHRMYRQYWYVLLPVHCATSVVWYGSFFIAAKSGVDIVPVLKAIGVTSETILSHLQDGNTGYFALAYAMYKVATPARYTVTLGCTTFSINYLKNKGYIKPVPSKQELQGMYEDKRDEMLKRSNEMLERSNEMRQQFHERRGELQGKLDQRRATMKKNFAGRRNAMKDRLEVRRVELKQRLEDSSDRFEERLDKMTPHEALNDMKENLEQTTEDFKKKLEGVETRMKKDILETNDDTKK